MALPVVCVEERHRGRIRGACSVKFSRELRVGPAYLPESQLGPAGSAGQKELVEECIARGVDEGAELILDGRGVHVSGYEGGYFVGPTIFDHVKPGHFVGDQEIFGPVTSIKRVKGFEEGLAIMNANEFANGSCIYTSSGRLRPRVRPAARTAAWSASTSASRCRSRSSHSAGHKRSFFGDLHTLGKDGVAFYTETKSVTSVWFAEAGRQGGGQHLGRHADPQVGRRASGPGGLAPGPARSVATRRRGAYADRIDWVESGA